MSLQDQEIKRSLKRLKKEQQRHANWRFKKEVIAIILACITAMLSVVVAKLIETFLTKSSNSSQVFLLGQSHWEYGTLAHIQFKKPIIKEGDGYFELRVPVAFLKTFEITSFNDQIFSFKKNRLVNLESIKPEQKNTAEMTIFTKNNQRFQGPHQFKISHVRKDDEGLVLQLHWASKEEKRVLYAYLSELEENIQSNAYLVFDFINEQSILKDYIGLISTGGKWQRKDNDIIYEFDLSTFIDFHDNTKTILYERGGENKKYMMGRSIRSGQVQVTTKDELSYDYSQSLIEDITAQNPEALLFLENQTVIARVKSISVHDNTIRIIFFNNEKSVLDNTNQSEPVNIILKMNLLTEWGQYVQGESEEKNHDRLIGSLSNDTKDLQKDNADKDSEMFNLEPTKTTENVGLISFREINLTRNGDYFLAEIDVGDTEVFTVESIFEKTLFSIDENPDKIFGGSATQAVYDLYSIHYDDHGVMMINCCTQLSHLEKKGDKIKFRLKPVNHEIDEKNISYIKENMMKGGATLNQLLFVEPSESHTNIIASKQGEARIKSDRVLIDIPLFPNIKGEYDNPHLVLFLLGQFNGFSNHVINRIKTKKDVPTVSQPLHTLISVIENHQLSSSIFLGKHSFHGVIDKIQLTEDMLKLEIQVIDSKNKEGMVLLEPVVIIIE